MRISGLSRPAIAICGCCNTGRVRRIATADRRDAANLRLLPRTLVVAGRGSCRKLHDQSSFMWGRVMGSRVRARVPQWQARGRPSRRRLGTNPARSELVNLSTKCGIERSGRSRRATTNMSLNGSVARTASSPGDWRPGMITPEKVSSCQRLRIENDDYRYVMREAVTWPRHQALPIMTRHLATAWTALSNSSGSEMVDAGTVVAPSLPREAACN
jgi:hypothetical protein